MDAIARIEEALLTAVGQADAATCPPLLRAALHHAVFPSGARVRPRLCLAVATACGDDRPDITDAAAAAIELLHCASLVHDDLPCFDDAALRRGKPSVHVAFGEPIAVLAGDALIVLAFETLARATADAPDRLSRLLLTVSRSVGVPGGIVAGQAWECETDVVLSDYQRSKTGSLFVAATIAGALAAGAAPTPWQTLGDCIGEAYQVADDLRDAVADATEIGKPTGQDMAHGRPNAAHRLGIHGAVARLDALVREAAESIPDGPHAGALRALVMAEAKRLRPAKIDLVTA